MRILAVYMQPESREEQETLVFLLALLKKHFSVKVVQREYLFRIKREKFSLVISLGGDGTFLKASRWILDNTPLLGINLNPKVKEGFYTRATLKSLTTMIPQLKKKQWTVQPLLRLEGFIGNKRLPYLALNEFFFGNAKAYMSAKYEINVKGKKEIHKNSGLLIATPSGSHAWYQSAGGKPLSFEEKSFVFLAREPYCQKVITCKLKQGKLSLREKVVITSLIKDGQLVIDSAVPFALPKGKTAMIKPSKHYLQWVIAV